MTDTEKRIPATLIRGDGIGPEIVEATLRVLDAVGAPFEWDEQLAGLAAVEKHGDTIPQDVIDSIRRNKLALKGPLTTPIGGGFRSVNVRLRETFKLFANVRPAHTFVDTGRYKDIDLVLIRENLEGMYVGAEHVVPVGDDPKAVVESTSYNTRFGCRRIAEYAFDYAVRNNRKKVTIVHKANILKELTGLFLETCYEVGDKYRDRLEIEDKIVDNTAMQLVLNPGQFDVIVTTNMFGDILSDEIAGLVGGLGLAPGGNIGHDAALFEAVHGSAPDIAGKGLANPTALILGAAMMLDHVKMQEKATLIRNALDILLKQGKTLTGDLGGNASTTEFTDAVIAQINSMQA
jgi:isocitrate dehydrogenase (NAD+)